MKLKTISATVCGAVVNHAIGCYYYIMPRSAIMRPGATITCRGLLLCARGLA